MDSMDSQDWPWSDEQKRKCVWGSIVERGQTRGSNTFDYYIFKVQNDGEYEPVFLSRGDHRTVLKDFEAEGKIKIINDGTLSFDELEFEKVNKHDPNQWQIQLLDTQQKRKSVYSYSIQSLADLLKDIDLRNQVRDLLVRYFSVHDIREIKPKQSTTTDVLEDKDELLLLMEELDLVKINWDSLKRQTHRVIGNRYIQVQFFGEKASQFADALYGRKSVIRPKALEQVATLIKDLMSQNKLNEHFVQLGVPYSLLLDNQHSKQDMVYNVLLALSSTGAQEDIDLLHKVLEEFAHPLIFRGDTKSSVDFQYKVTKVIRYDGLSLLGGKVRLFDDSDTKKMEDLERQEYELSAGLMETFSEVFGGNPFGQPQQKQQAESQNTEPKQNHESQTHIHIYNDNKAVQTVNLSDIKESDIEHDVPTISLKGAEIVFDDDSAQIKVDGTVCQLPPYKDEHLLARAIFEYKKDEPVDWSVAFEKMTGKEPEKSDKTSMSTEERKVYDATNALNKRIIEVINTENKLLCWKDKTITRRF